MDIDDCLSQVVGCFGRYQVFIYCFSAIYALSMPSLNLMIVFVGADPTSLSPDNSRVNCESSILTEWDLLDNQWLVGLTQSLFFGGFLFGVILMGQASDKYGRRICVILGFLFLIPACLFTSFSISFEMFAALRFVTGFLLGGAGLVQFVYLQEIVESSYWAITGSIQGLLFATGEMFLVFAAYFIPGWRAFVGFLTVLQLPPLILIIIFYPESPRWLYAKGDVKGAETVLLLMAKRNGVKNPVISLKPLVIDHAEKSSTIVDVFQYKATAKRMAVMMFIWFVSSLVSYSLMLAAGKIGKSTYASEALMGLIEIPAHLLCLVFMSRPWCGRRLGTSLSLFITGLSCLGLMAYDPNEATNLKLAFGLMGKLGITFCFNGIYIYSPELFPTSVRNVAVGALSMTSRVGGIISSFSKSFIAVHPLLAYGTYGTFGIVAGMLALLLPETLGKKPPDSFDDFDVLSLKSHLNNPNNYLLLSSGFDETKNNETTTLLEEEENTV